MSPALLAYYNPIRQSRRHAATSPLSRLIRRAFAVRARRGDPRDLPYFHCRTVHTCRRPYAGGSGRPPVTMASRYQASSTSQRVATHNCPSLPAIPDGVKHFGAASFASCCGPCVCLALLTGYDEEEPPRLHLASAELRHSRLDRDMSPPPGESQARWANGKPPIVGTCTRQVTAASEAARGACFETKTSRSVPIPSTHVVAVCTNRWFTSVSARTCGFVLSLGIRVSVPLPDSETRLEFIKRYASSSAERLDALRSQPESWWEAETRFFDTTRSRAWVVVRRITHTSHHRGQQMAMLRMLNRDLHSSYDPRPTRVV